MTPREVIDKIVAGEMRAHTEELTRQLEDGCQDCARKLTGPGGHVLDPTAVSVRRVELLYGQDRRLFRVSCGECARTRSGVHGVALEDSKPIPGTNPVAYEPIRIAVNGPPPVPALTDVLRDGDIGVFKVPAGHFFNIDAMKQALEGRTAIVLPDSCDVQKMNLDELRKFRDQLNEVIYDRERAG